MNNENYTRNEFEFYAKFYTHEELKSNYTFNELMALYLFGMNILNKINFIIENELFGEVEATPMEIYRDKTIFSVKTYVVKSAIESLEACEVFSTEKSMFVVHKN
jgi:hypothetical protein